MSRAFRYMFIAGWYATHVSHIAESKQDENVNSICLDRFLFTLLPRQNLLQRSLVVSLGLEWHPLVRVGGTRTTEYVSKIDVCLDSRRFDRLRDQTEHVGVQRGLPKSFIVANQTLGYVLTHREMHPDAEVARRSPNQWPTRSTCLLRTAPPSLDSMSSTPRW